MTEEIISPLYDFAFAQIFGNQKNIDNTRAFLKAVLDIPEDDYDKLTVESPILQRIFRRDKMGVVDLKLSTKSGKIIHIELQVNKRANLKSRIMYYAARLLGDQMQWGDDYSELHEVISIVICDHVLLKKEESYINMYELRNERNHSFTNLLKIVILELPKLPETEDSSVWPWLRFFTCKRKEEFEMLARKHPELEKPIWCARKMSLRERWRDYQFHKQLWKMDERALQEQIRIDAREEGLAEGHAEGHAEGLAEGLAEGHTAGHAEGHAEGIAQTNLEIARKMKIAGRPWSEITEFTGFSSNTIETL